MRELSIFIDESGDFGNLVTLPSYYLVTLVFHDQAQSIQEQVHQLEKSTHYSGFDLDYIHTGPLIRREEVFKNYSIDERRKLIYKILNFMNSVPIFHDTIAVNRKYYPDRMSLITCLSRELSQMISEYRLLQVADFICTLELIRIKRDEKRLSRSEKKFFYRPQELKKLF
ncbi:MAG: hypothetical protein PT957_04565 [Firmicutes bacterium]|nr:hypothetical protein [Bacillota bacterium]